MGRPNITKRRLGAKTFKEIVTSFNKGIRVKEIREEKKVNITYQSLYLRKEDDEEKKSCWDKEELERFMQLLRTVERKKQCGEMIEGNVFEYIAQKLGTKSACQCRNKYYTLPLPRPNVTLWNKKEKKGKKKQHLVVFSSEYMNELFKRGAAEVPPLSDTEGQSPMQTEEIVQSDAEYLNLNFDLECRPCLETQSDSSSDKSLEGSIPLYLETSTHILNPEYN